MCVSVGKNSGCRLIAGMHFNTRKLSQSQVPRCLQVRPGFCSTWGTRRHQPKVRTVARFFFHFPDCWHCSLSLKATKLWMSSFAIWTQHACGGSHSSRASWGREGWIGAAQTYFGDLGRCLASNPPSVLEQLRRVSGISPAGVRLCFNANATHHRTPHAPEVSNSNT